MSELGVEPAVEADPFVGGTTRPRSTRVDVMNPAAPDERVGSVGLSTQDDVDAAVRAADSARAVWSGHDAATRGAVLMAAAERMDEQSASLSDLLCREHGKTRAEAAAELAGAAQIVRWHAEQSEVLDPVVTHDARGRVVTRRVPVGVVAVIVPWNYPVLLAQLMVAPALLAGNCVVVKLPDHSPLTLSLILAELARTLPDGVLNVVAGDGPLVGAALTTHPLVRKIAFTGSTPTGRAIMRAASDTLKGLSLELGGNDAAVVLEDARLDADLVGELVSGTLASAGQVCYAPKRLYVHRRHQEHFVERFRAAAETVVVGDGRDPEVTLGPLNNADQRDRVVALLTDAEARGAQVVPLGREATTRHDDGLFVRPHLVVETDPDSPLMQQEQFGPLIPVLFFDDEDEAIEHANATEYGLAASVWSDDVDRAFEVAERIEAGTVFVNIHRVGASSVAMPFGGFKQSGIGRGHGIEGIHEYTELQVLAQREDMRRAT